MPTYQRKRVSLEVSKKASLFDTSAGCLCYFTLLVCSGSLSFICMQVTGCGEATGYDTIDAVIAALQLC